MLKEPFNFIGKPESLKIEGGVRSRRFTHEHGCVYSAQFEDIDLSGARYHQFGSKSTAIQAGESHGITRIVVPIEFMFTALATVGVGVLIGTVGVGGVLLAPLLALVAGLSVQQAIGIAMLGFVLPGFVALLTEGRRKVPAVPSVGRLLAATIPGAVAGTTALAHLPQRAALLVLAFAVSYSGVRLLLQHRFVRERPKGDLPAKAGVLTGLMVGFLSALTGTSGPLVLTPLLLSRGVLVTESIVMGQLVQLPIAASATFANLLAGTVQLIPGIAIGTLMLPGVLFGARLRTAIPLPLLARLVGLMLVAAGVALFGKVLR